VRGRRAKGGTKVTMINIGTHGHQPTNKARTHARKSIPLLTTENAFLPPFRQQPTLLDVRLCNEPASIIVVAISDRLKRKAPGPNRGIAISGIWVRSSLTVPYNN
jgi:hypothetical protein